MDCLLSHMDHVKPSFPRTFWQYQLFRILCKQSDSFSNIMNVTVHYLWEDVVDCLGTFPFLLLAFSCTVKRSSVCFFVVVFAIGFPLILYIYMGVGYHGHFIHVNHIGVWDLWQFEFGNHEYSVIRGHGTIRLKQIARNLCEVECAAPWCTELHTRF